MTILSKDALSLFVDLIADGNTVRQATVAIGGRSSSKIAHLWINDSKAAGDFDMPPSESEPWCIIRDGTPQWFHIAYADAVIAGRVAKTIRRTPLRSELEAKLRTKRGEPPKQPGYLPPRVMVGKPSDEPAGPKFIVDAPVPPAPKPRPSYAYRAPALDGVQRHESGPHQEGRFTVAADRPKSKAERRAGTVELTDQGIRQW